MHSGPVRVKQNDVMSQGETQNRPHDRRLVGWLSLAQLVSWGSVFYLFALVMGPVERELGLSRVQSSLAFSLCLLTEGLLAFPIGRLIDRGQERWVMTAGSVLMALGLVLHALVSSLAGFYAVWMLLGVGMSMTLYQPVFAVVTRRFPQDFRRAIITLTFLGGLASTVFIPLTAWLITSLGWRGAVLVLAAFNLALCAPLHFYWLRHAPGKSALEPGIEPAIEPAIQRAFEPVTTNAATPTAPALSLSAQLKSAPYLLIGLSIAFMTVATAALPSHMVTLLREYGLDERWVIAIPASIGVLQVLGRLVLYFFEHRFDVHLANRLIPGLMPLGLALLAAAPLLAAPQSPQMLLCLMVFVLLWGMGNGMLTIVKGTAMAQYVGREHVASLNGALGVPLALVRAAAPLGLGWLWTAQAGYRNGLIVMMAMGLAGVVALVLAQRLARAT